MVTNYQNLLIDIDPDHCTDHRHRPTQRIESKLELMKPDHEFDIPLSIQRIKRTKTGRACLETRKNTISASRQSFTPSRERVQFDFNPKDLNELCKTIEQAKIHRHAKSLPETNTKSPSKKTTAIIQPMIDSVDPKKPSGSFMFSKVS